MSQRDRDRLVVLKKAKERLITQREASMELEVSVRQVRRLLRALGARGDKAVQHGGRGKASNRRIAASVESKAVEMLSGGKFREFGPTLAAEYLRAEHGIEVSRETARQWMMRAKLWKGKRKTVSQVHQWRPRRSRSGELVQWDTSSHDWLEGRGERLYLIAMIDDATSRLYARFVRQDTTEENMKVLWGYLNKYGRPAAFYTDKASMFQTTERRKRDEPGVDKDPREMEPTQIERALRELGIGWSAAHSPQAKGRVERSFRTGQDRLVKGMRVAGVNTLEQANQYLDEHYLAWWDKTLTVVPAAADDAHRPLDKSHDLAASLSHVETRVVRPDYTFSFGGTLFQIERGSIVAGLRGSQVRVEHRLDGTIAARYQDRYLEMSICNPRPKVGQQPAKTPRLRSAAAGTAANAADAAARRKWTEDFDLKKSMPVWKAAQASGNKPEPS